MGRDVGWWIESRGLLEFEFGAGGEEVASDEKESRREKHIPPYARDDTRVASAYARFCRASHRTELP